jgi:glycosyltransferase involved in cell wall biosynthesis
MKLCFISPGAYPVLDSSIGGGFGGAEAQLCTIGKELSKHGHEVHYIVDDYGQEENLVIENLFIHKAALRYLGGSNKYVVPDWWKIVRTIGTIRADYYFIKVPQHLLLLMGIYCFFARSKMVFIGQKDSDFDEASYRKKEGAIGWWMYRIGLMLADTVVAQTDYQRKGFRDVFKKNAIVIRNVLTLGHDNIARKENYVLWVGNSSDDKQPRLVPELARQLPDVRFRMIMSGGNHDPNDEYVREQAESIENLEYLGQVPFSSISEHYKGARLFISTSLCEGFPNTFLQSWQYRLPVISLNVDPDDVIKTNNLGRVSGTITKMKDDINELYNNVAVCDSLGKNAEAYAYKYHSLEVVTSAYLRLIGS